MDRYVLSRGSTPYEERVISIYDSLAEAQQGALNYMENENKVLQKYLDVQPPLNLEWVQEYNQVTHKYYYTAKTYHCYLTISIVECNKQKFD